MRLIGHLSSEPDAKAFGDYLLVRGVENNIEPETASSWGVWIIEEDKIGPAADLLKEFQANPADPRYRSEGKSAAQLREAKEKDQERYRKRMLDRRHLFRPLRGYGFGPLTFVLIVLSVAVFFLSGFGSSTSEVRGLFITSFWPDGDYIRWQAGLPEIRHGQIWRLVTPMLVHFHILHILFNMLWLRDLGSMIEARQSTLRLALLVLVTAAVSNLAQYYITHSPMFGGMSGVVYGLLGYVWMRGRFDPGSGLFVHQPTVVMMIIWFVAGFSGWLGPIANWAHAGGFAVGISWGYLSSLRYR